jgi:hypothetical protein
MSQRHCHLHFQKSVVRRRERFGLQMLPLLCVDNLTDEARRNKQQEMPIHSRERKDKDSKLTHILLREALCAFATSLPPTFPKISSEEKPLKSGLLANVHFCFHSKNRKLMLNVDVFGGYHFYFGFL